MDTSKALNLMRIPMAFWEVWFHSYISTVPEPMTYNLGFLIANFRLWPSIFFNDTAFLGVIAVNIFILISGFGLTYSHYKKKPTSNYKYFKKRFLKIMPIYWIALSFAILWNVIVFKYTPSFFSIFTHILGIHVFFPTTLFDINGALWFVGLLIPFYLSFPLMIKVYESKYGFWKLMAFGVLPKFLIGMYVFPYSSNPPRPWLEFLVDFVIGMHLAKMYVLDEIKKVSNKIALPAIFLSLAAIILSRNSYVDLHSLQAPYLDSAYAIIFLFGMFGVFNLFPKFFRKVGTLGVYRIFLATVLEVYLFHSPLVDYVKYRRPDVMHGDPVRTFIFALCIFLSLGLVISLFQMLSGHIWGHVKRRIMARSARLDPVTEDTVI